MQLFEVFLIYMDFYNTFESLTNVVIQSLFGFLDSCDRFESCLALQGEVQVSIYSFESPSCANFLVHHHKVKQRSKQHRQAQLKSHIKLSTNLQRDTLPVNAQSDTLLKLIRYPPAEIIFFQSFASSLNRNQVPTRGRSMISKYILLPLQLELK